MTQSLNLLLLQSFEALDPLFEVNQRTALNLIIELDELPATLGELGQIIESREAVMQVRFYRYPGQTPQPIHGDIYLQGALLMDYEHGQWRAGQATDLPGSTQLEREALPRSGLVRQVLSLAPVGQGVRMVEKRSALPVGSMIQKRHHRTLVMVGQSRQLLH